MMSMHLSEAAQVLNARQLGANVMFHGVSTDTRTLVTGNLFIALQGPHFDGHAYLRQARDRHAAAAVVVAQSADGLPLLEVADTRLALGELAAHWRSRFNLPLVAVTGSNGKTTVKEMVASILGRCGETLMTRGNFNNDIGVPHTLFRLSAEHRYAVLELGANHAGEIAYLTQLVRPQVGVVNNAGPAHLEGFGDLAGVANAKGELYAGMAADALCVINADDAFAELWRSLAKPRAVMSFGLHAAADVTAQWSGNMDGSELVLHTPAGTIEFHLPLPGKHNVMNALAAATATLALNVPLHDIAQGLSAVRPVQGRWQIIQCAHDLQLVDDTYNANPASLQAALELLSTHDRESWLVLGDMGELGATRDRIHRQVGEAVRQAGVRRLFVLGELAQEAATAFGEGAESFSEVDALITRLQHEVRPGVTLLVKGSRTMRMERVIAALREVH